eukprot:m.225036 g.225036  ORF g.225036 m.225036 type:complete len:561 (-) comp17302_c0_seq21:2266-3948(-)
MLQGLAVAGLGLPIVLALTAEFGTAPFFVPGRELTIARLLEVRKHAQEARLLIAHDFGDAGFTSKEWRGNYCVRDKPNIIMLNDTWSWDDIHQPLPKKHLTQAINNLGPAIVDEGAVAAMTELFDRGWMFNTAFWRLPEFMIARLLESDDIVTKDPAKATLVLLNGNTTGAVRYLERAKAAGRPKYQHHHFGVVPYGKTLSVSLLSEYRLDDSDRVLARYARLHPGDIAMPYLSELHPRGPKRLSDLEQLYTKPRRWLVSFVGSSYRPGSHDFLTSERYNVLRGLVKLNARYMREGTSCFKKKYTRQLLNSGVLKFHGLSHKQLFLIPMTPFPNNTNLGELAGLRASAGRFKRTFYNVTGGSIPPEATTASNLLMAQLVAASSIFSLQIPGDGPIRSGQIHALAMGAIPVLVDWQVEAVASLFNGILFETQDRFEDIFVILDWEATQADPEYVFQRLLGIVARGEHIKRQRRLRRLVDYITYRRDGEHEDAISLLIGLLQQQRADLLAGTYQSFAKVKEWPHRRRYSREVTGTTSSRPFRLRPGYKNNPFSDEINAAPDS